MNISKLIARQLSGPSGITGWLAGWVWNWRNAALNDQVLVLLDLQPTDRVLDIGFGGGYLLNRMAAVVTGGLLAGVDISSAMVTSAENRYRRTIRGGKLDLRCAGAEALPYPDAHFTRVCTVNSIFYWQDAAKGIGEIYRVLRTKGRAVLCFTCKESLEQKRFAKNIQLYQADAVAQMMTNCGFQDLQAKTFADRHRQYVTVVGTKRFIDKG